MVTCIDLDLFYGKVKFCFIGFYGKKVTLMNILKIISACDLDVDRYCQLNDKISYIFIYYFI